ncbi:MAG: hypothetical protein AAGA02_04630 [Bacteroidota bacterium]
MELNDLKETWTGGMANEVKSQAELIKMTQLQNHPDLKRARLRLVIEGVILILFLGMYYEALDGAEKSLGVNILLVISCTAFVVVRFAGWLAIRKPIKYDNISTSMIAFLKELKRISRITQVTSTVFGLAFILYFISGLELRTVHYPIILGMIITLILLVFWSSRIWNQRTTTLEKILVEFDENENK